MDQTTPPIVLTAWRGEPLARTSLSEPCDCACAEEGFSLVEPNLSPDTLFQCASGSIHHLPQGYLSISSPSFKGSLAVLNPDGLETWLAYRTPHTLSSVSPPVDAKRVAAAKTMIDIGLLEPVGSQRQWQRSTPYTLGAWLHITNACNLACDYCYLIKSNEHMTEQVGRASIDALIRSAVKGSFRRIKIKFAGGEPTLHVDLILDLHAYALRQADRVGIEAESIVLTNGVALSERAITAFGSRGIRVMISLDGIGAYHDSQRTHINGKGSFAEVERTLDRLTIHGLEPFICITVSGRNAVGLPAVVSYLLDRGLPFSFNFFRDNRQATAEGLTLVDDKIIKALDQAFAVIEAKMPPYSLLGSLLDRSLLHRPHERTCGVGESYLVFDPRGGVAKCHMEIAHPVSDVDRDDPLSDASLDRCGVQNISVDAKEGCRDCEWKYWCAGGCPLVTFLAAGRYDTRSPYCRIYRAAFPQMIRLESLRLMKQAGIAV